MKTNINKEYVILGEGCKYSTDPADTGLNNNVVVVGSPGSGKTYTYTLPRMQETFQSSLIVNVSKRSIVPPYAQMFKARGYKVYDLNLADLNISACGYDPLCCIKTPADIKHFASCIVKAKYISQGQESRVDPYWDQAASDRLSFEIAYTLYTKKDATFADVMDLHNSFTMADNSSTVKSNFDALASKLPLTDTLSAFAVNCWKSISGLNIKTASCIFSTLETVMNTVFTPELLSLMRKPKEKMLNIPRVSTEKSVVFITTAPDDFAMSAFVNIFYGQVFKALTSFAAAQPNYRLPVPVHLICDDFAVSPIPNFPKLIAIMREMRLSVSLLLQSESQLTGIFGSSDSSTVLNCCDTYLYLGGMDLDTCRSISTRTNKPLEHILSMPVGSEIVFRRGQKPIFTRRYDILNDPLYKRIMSATNISDINDSRKPDGATPRKRKNQVQLSF